MSLFGWSPRDGALRHQSGLEQGKLSSFVPLVAELGKPVCYRLPWRNGVGWHLMRRGGWTRGKGTVGSEGRSQPSPPPGLLWAPEGQQPQAFSSSSPSAQRGFPVRTVTQRLLCQRLPCRGSVTTSFLVLQSRGAEITDSCSCLFSRRVLLADASYLRQTWTGFEA